MQAKLSALKKIVKFFRNVRIVSRELYDGRVPYQVVLRERCAEASIRKQLDPTKINDGYYEGKIGGVPIRITSYYISDPSKQNAENSSDLVKTTQDPYFLYAYHQIACYMLFFMINGKKTLPRVYFSMCYVHSRDDKDPNVTIERVLFCYKTRCDKPRRDFLFFNPANSTFTMQRGQESMRYWWCVPQKVISKELRESIESLLFAYLKSSFYVFDFGKGILLDVKKPPGNYSKTITTTVHDQLVSNLLKNTITRGNRGSFNAKKDDMMILVPRRDEVIDIIDCTPNKKEIDSFKGFPTFDICYC